MERKARCDRYWFPVSPDDEGDGNNQSQYAQSQEHAQGNDHSLVGGGALGVRHHFKVGIRLEYLV